MKARTRRRLQFGALGLVVFIAITTIAVTVLPHQNDPQQQITYTQPPRATGADWDGYLMDATNSAYNQQEKTLSPQMIAHLRPIGMFDIGQNIPSKDAVSSSVVSVGNTLYFGSWDGYEYAVNATTFALRWRQFLGITTPPAADQCFPASAGVSSNALISGDNLYVGGGAGSMYDLDPTTGTIIWQTKITTPPDGYIWGSPLLAHGRIYIGTSSYGDCPLIRASIDMLDAATGQLLKVHYTVGPNEVGNSIWSKGVLDAADHAVIFATGNGPAGDPESQAIVALNWDTLDVIGTWAVPKYELGGDSDFGSSCLLVPDVGGGRRGVVCHNKNGYLYAVAVSPTGLSLSWALKLGRGGDAPEHDMGDINESVFDGKYLYAATETMTDDEGHTYASAVYKIDPATATILWVSPINNFFSLNALAGANGFLVMGLTDQNYNGAFIVISTATGAHLYQQILSSAILFAPSIADGEILLPTLDGHLYIYSEVSEPTATANLASKTLPVGWKWLAAQPGRTALTGQGATITAGAGTTVENNLLLRSLPVGDFTIEAPIAEPLVDGTARAGIVAYASPGNYVLLSILTQDGQDKTFEMLNYYQNKLVNRSTIDDPIAGEGTILLQLVQMPPNRYIGYTSRDGTHWLKVGDFTVPFSVTLGGVDAYAPDRAMIRPATFAWCQITSLNGQ
jgi:outer membrane protein assembly factor BamB